MLGFFRRKIKLKYYIESQYEKDVIIPTIAYSGTSACFDLFAVKTIIIPKGGSAFVPVGIRFIIPKGYYIKLADRSGNGIKKGLHIHPGIFDPGYTGEYKINCRN